ncbi:hypothetical protein A6J40_03355 [Legionella longbeachae]|uniref:Uncharacterized protein n=1 Tax=Legionella longbeachae serogroup 1 (strain NSW150) TaxID=661367 RepID=D3HSQ6_LEGLN|nr:hypothetical protein A6J40_03355 [Legionella longbeachae]EEZ94918.1 hypothetical protein LLB_0069 [Legionella longbeachae D-4968]CBJ11945.1 protein of unknown function [Legionella longbeachae NSW150]VEE02440.1 Uncharacterised protein [Legionella oakridgensis]ARM32292.1 hypothetical protein B0B39_01525 [Legionella longbeachae]
MWYINLLEITIKPSFEEVTPSLLFYGNLPDVYFQIPESKRIAFLIKILAHSPVHKILLKLILL